MDKPIYVVFAILELGKLHMYETYSNNLQPCFGGENLQLNYVDTDGMILSLRTENNVNDLKNLEDLSNFSILYENYEILSNKNKKLLVNIK